MREEAIEDISHGLPSSVVRKTSRVKNDGSERKRARKADEQDGMFTNGLLQWRPDFIREGGIADSRYGRGRIGRLLRDSNHTQDDSWLDAEVFTTAQKPFDSLAAWGEIMRYNSSAGVMLQLALPLQTVRQMRETIGADPEIVKRRFGASADLGQTSLVTSEDGSSVRLQSVLISGDRIETSRLRHAIRALRDLPAKPEQPASAIASKVAAFAMNKSKQAAPKLRTRRRPRKVKMDATGKILTDTELPSEKIENFSSVIRERTREGVFKFELALPEEVWELMANFPVTARWRTVGILTDVTAFDDRGVVHLRLEVTEQGLDSLRMAMNDAILTVDNGNYEGPGDHNLSRPSGTRTTTASQTSQPTTEIATDDKTILQPHPLAEKMKCALRALSHPVVVVLAGTRREVAPHPQVEERVEQCLQATHGATISSFTTVTLHPEPIISFNLKLPSRTWDAILDCRHFNLHLLHASQDGASLAHLFTQPHSNASEFLRRLTRLHKGTPIPSGEAEGAAQNLSPRLTGGRTTVYFTEARTYPRPRLRGEAILARLAVELLRDKCVQVGDHVIVVARVVDLMWNIDISTEDAEGLAYAKRGYRGVSAEIKPGHMEEDGATERGGSATSATAAAVKEQEPEQSDPEDFSSEGTAADEANTMDNYEAVKQDDATKPQHSVSVDMRENVNDGGGDSFLLANEDDTSTFQKTIQPEISEIVEEIKIPSFDISSCGSRHAGDEVEQRSDTRSPSCGDSAVEGSIAASESKVGIESPTSTLEKDSIEDPQEREQADLAVIESLSRYDDDENASPRPPHSEAKADIIPTKGNLPLEVEQDVELSDAEVDVDNLLKGARRTHDADLRHTVSNNAQRRQATETFASEGPSKPEKRGPTAAWGL